MKLSRIQHLKLNRNLQSSHMLANLCNKPTRVTTYLLFGKMHHRNNPTAIIKQNMGPHTPPLWWLGEAITVRTNTIAPSSATSSPDVFLILM